MKTSLPKSTFFLLVFALASARGMAQEVKKQGCALLERPLMALGSCLSDSVVFDAGTFRGATYSWDFNGDGNMDLLHTATGQVKHLFASAGNYAPFVVIFTDSCTAGNRNDINQALDIAPVATPAFKVEKIVCEQVQARQIALPGQKVDSLVWKLSDGTVYKDKSFIHSFSTSMGTRFEISLLAYLGQCVSASTKTVSFHPVEAVPMVSASAACAPAVVSLSQPHDSLPLSYTWYVGGMPVSSSASHVMHLTSGAMLDVALVVKGQDGCEDSAFMESAIVIAEPVVANAWASDTAVCVGQDLELMPRHSGHDGQAIYWGDGAVDTLLNTRTHSYVKPGLYLVNVLAVNTKLNCVDTLTLQVRAFGVPHAEFSLGLEGACVPQVVEMDNKSKGKFTSMVLVMNQFDTLSFDQALLLRDPGTYEFRLSLANGLSTCQSEFVSTLDLVSPLSTDHSVTISRISSEDGAYHIQWNGGEKMTAYELSLVQGTGYEQLAVVEDTQYQWVPAAGNDSFPVFVVRGMDACGAVSAYSNKASAMALTGHYQTDSMPTLSWTPFTAWGESLAHYQVQKNMGDGWIAVGESNQPHFIDTEFDKQETLKAEYRVVAVHENGVWNSTSTLYSFGYESEIFIPTAFSPNYDNVNDIYEIVGTGMGQMQVQIFNRWGQMVYDNQGEKTEWDGKHRGNMVEAGTYICVVDMVSPNGRSFNYQKAITLIR